MHKPGRFIYKRGITDYIAREQSDLYQIQVKYAF